MRSWLRQRAHRLRVEAHAVWLAVRDDRTPLFAKLIGVLVAAYGLSPIDLIPDFVPVLGLLDDLILLPLGIWLFLTFIPDDVWAEHIAAAELETERPVSWRGAIGVIAVWIIAMLIVALYVWSWRYW